MDEFKQLLTQRITDCEDIIRICKDQKNPPVKGHLRVSGTAERPMFYHVTDKGEHYLTKEEQPIAKALAQQEYVKKLHSQAVKEHKYYQRLYDTCHPLAFRDLYEKLPDSRKALIDPLVLDDASYIQQWKDSFSSDKNTIHSDITYSTKNGELVRSKSELLLANLLFDNKVPYVYEKRLLLNDGKAVYPDFILLNLRTRKTIVYEHFGMMDDEGYRTRAFQKIAMYIRNGYIPGVNFFYTFESSSVPLDLDITKTLLDALLF